MGISEGITGPDYSSPIIRLWDEWKDIPFPSNTTVSIFTP
jgi:hypothetical protein